MAETTLVTPENGMIIDADTEYNFDIDTVGRWGSLIFHDGYTKARHPNYKWQYSA